MEHSKNFEKVRTYYKQRLWTLEQVQNAVGKWITKEEYEIKYGGVCMSYSIKGTTITLTRGDSFAADISIFQPNGEPYELSSGDKVRFAMKKAVKDQKVLILRDVPIDTMRLVLYPEDTKDLDFGNYVYDIQLTKSNGEVDTFITRSVLILSEEVE